MNLTEWFLSQMVSIGGVNLVKIADNHGARDFSMFTTIGSCDVKMINNITELDHLLECYLVWYKPNNIGQNGWHIAGSMNYSVKEYIQKTLDSSIMLQDNIKNLVESLSGGIKSDIDIMVAEDLILDKSIIVDGTKRALALLLIRNNDPDNINNILNAGNSVRVAKFRSKYCRIMFPCDFLKLCLKQSNDRLKLTTAHRKTL